MTLEEFEQLVSEALDSLPEEFGKRLSNVQIVVETWPTRLHLQLGNVRPGMTLFGLYQGVPQTKRGQYQAVLPDKITIFAGPIITSIGEDTVAIKQQVTKTVLHEIGHHFGMSEAEIRDALP